MIKTIIKLFILWQLALLIVTSLSGNLLPLRESYLGGGGTRAYLRNPLLFSRANFDGVHYTSIAQNGYGYAQQAFFPLYPNLIRSLGFLVKSPVWAGLLISNVSFFMGLVYLHRLIVLDHPESIAKWSIIGLLLFPTSFYFGAVYTEGLFFLLLISAFYYARTGKWWLAGILGALATNTRFVGIFIFPALIAEWWIVYKDLEFPRQKIKKLLPLLLIPVGLLIYMDFLNRTTGDPLAFIHVQKLFGQARSDKVILLYQVFWRYFKMLATVNRQDPLYITIVAEAVTGAVFLFVTLYSFIKSRFSYALFSLAAFLVPTLTGNFVSLPRYVLVCFPGFILLGGYLSQAKQKTRVIILSLMGAGFVLLLGLFARGYWVA